MFPQMCTDSNQTMKNPTQLLLSVKLEQVKWSHAVSSSRKMKFREIKIGVSETDHQPKWQSKFFGKKVAEWI